MADHAHFEPMRRSTSALPALLSVFLLEGFAGIFAGRLAVNAHTFDVFSDLVAIVVVIIGSGVSGFLDDRGRVHKQVHREQFAIAALNLLILAAGASFVLVRSILSFGEESQNTSWKDWWVVTGPILAIFVYWWVRERLTRLKANDLTMTSLEVHVKGDVAVSFIVATLTVLSLVWQTGWVNPAGGIIVSVILFYFCLELGKHIQVEVGEIFRTK